MDLTPSAALRVTGCAIADRIMSSSSDSRTSKKWGMAIFDIGLVGRMIPEGLTWAVRMELSWSIKAIHDKLAP